jgi:hypothetical protein
MTWLDTFVQIGAISVVAVPIVTLAIGVALYFFLPSQRRLIGIILVTFGVFGSLIYLWVLYIAAIHSNVKILMIMIFIVEIITLVVGVISLTSNRVSAKNRS